jgi:hypothetical protein
MSMTMTTNAKLVKVKAPPEHEWIRLWSSSLGMIRVQGKEITFESPGGTVEPVQDVEVAFARLKTSVPEFILKQHNLPRSERAKAKVNRGS